MASKKIWENAVRVTFEDDYKLWHVRNLTEKDKDLDPDMQIPKWYLHEPIFFLRANVKFDLDHFLSTKGEDCAIKGRNDTVKLPVDEFTIGGGITLLLVHSMKDLNKKIKQIDPTFKYENDTDSLPAAWWFHRNKISGWIQVPDQDSQKITEIMISFIPHSAAIDFKRTITALEAQQLCCLED